MTDTVSNIQVFVTCEYDKFQKLLGNRDLSRDRLSAIKESILRIGYQPSPIIVNEKLEVIDGQGRLAACESLNLPILYITKPGLNIDDCISMNIKMKNWVDADYINCYAARGYEPYKAMKEMLAEFPLLNWQQIYSIGANTYGSLVREAMRNGKLQFESFAYTQYERARWLSAIKPILKDSGLNTNRAIETLIRLDKYKLINQSRMLEAIEKYAHNPEFSSKRTKDTIYALNEIYNFNRKRKVYFADRYKETTEKLRGRKGAQNA